MNTIGSIIEKSLNSHVYSTYLDPSRKDKHYGIDLHAHDENGMKVNNNVRIIAHAQFKVVYAGWTNTGWGNLVKGVDTKTGEFFYYAHFASLAVKTGQLVKQGEVLGIMGTTGNSTGIHVHFEVRNKTDVRSNGTVDPAPYCGVENVKGNTYPYTDGERTYYKQRLYVDEGHTMPLDDFLKAKAAAPVELIMIGCKDGVAHVAYVKEATLDPNKYKDLPKGHYVY